MGWLRKLFSCCLDSSESSRRNKVRGRGETARTSGSSNARRQSRATEGYAEYIERLQRNQQLQQETPETSETDLSELDWSYQTRLAEKYFEESVEAKPVCNTPVLEDLMLAKYLQDLTVVSNVVDISEYLCFLPVTVVHGLVKKYSSTVPPQESTQAEGMVFDSFYAAVLFADASGFTDFIERLKSKTNGAELPGQTMNEKFFAPILSVIREAGGDVIKFSGDALTVVFPVNDLEGASKTRKEAILRAAQCSIDMQAALKEIESSSRENDDDKFTLHTGLAAGEVTILQAGGTCDRFEYYVAGTPLAQIRLTEPLANSGETVVSKEALNIAEDNLETGKSIIKIRRHSTKFLNGLKGVLHTRNNQGSWVCLDRKQKLTDTQRKYCESLEPPFLDCFSQRNILETKCKQLTGVRSIPEKVALRVPDVPPEILPHIEKYIPTAVSSRLMAGQQTFLDEMRTVSIVFARIPAKHFDFSTQKGIRDADNMMVNAQTAVYTQEGSVNKFSVDDKGVTALIVFGLAPLLHSDDPLRAMVAGQRIVQKLKQLDLPCTVGVTTGRVWCGVIGDAYRREYTVYGRAVNMAARLMTTEKNSGLLCDLNTEEKVENRLAMEELDPIAVKGIEGPVRVFKTNGEVVALPEETWLSRWPEWEEDKKLQKLLSGDTNSMIFKGGVFCIFGESGIGKTTMLKKTEALARSSGMTIIIGSNQQPTDLTVRKGHLAAWHHILKEILMHERRVNRHMTNAEILDYLVSPKEMHKDLGLLEDIFYSCDTSDKSLRDRKLEEFRRLRSFDIPNLRERIYQLVYEVIKGFVERRSCVLILHMRQGTSIYGDDDEDTWRLAVDIAKIAKENAKNKEESMKRAFIFGLVCRGLDHRKSTPHKQERQICSILKMAKKFDAVIDMKRFDMNTCTNFLAYLLKTDPGRLPENLKDYVFQLTGGNPHQIICTTKQLRKKFMERQELLSGRVVDFMTCQNISNADLWDLPIHPDMYGVTITNIERLHQDQQLLIKMCAAFEEKVFDAYAAFGPVDIPANQFQHHFKQLVKIGFFKAESIDYRAAELSASETHATESESGFSSECSSSLVQAQFSKWFRANGSFRRSVVSTSPSTVDAVAESVSESSEPDFNIYDWQYRFTSQLTRTVARRLNTTAQRQFASALARKQSSASSVLARRRSSTMSPRPLAEIPHGSDNGSLASSSSLFLNVPLVRQVSSAPSTPVSNVSVPIPDMNEIDDLQHQKYMKKLRKK